ncbi:outer membrane beta-barrel family protein [Spirosoma pollinicola]|uniref:Outer membrane protein beta-barrel domain-containing protein n=1 Tax=Spirosoma pollinicola TaxID=2057025 RepID=A0A2K8Z806_9BACT|nr:outer membrane beta-barrel family protein [Spirosoma pollinicola]AUD05980.1 hypothetical protein CWM47_31525 [Spirosoma pollinicola]
MSLARLFVSRLLSLIGLLCFPLFSTGTTYGQSLSGQVQSQTEHQPLVGVHATLVPYASPTSPLYATSQQEGRFRFDHLKEGLYRLTLSHVGYQTLVMDSLACQGEPLALGWVSLAVSQQAIAEIVVRAKKPQIRYESDRFRVDVKAMNTRGDQAVDLVRRIPGVKLDREGELSLQGKTGVLVYINGKQSYLTGSALLSYLKSLSASDIASIDFLPTPPASYDAAGSGGVMDIHLRQRTDDGYSVNSSFSVVPVARPRSTLSTMVTSRWGKWESYGQLGLDHSPTYERETTDRQVAGRRFGQESRQVIQPTDLTGMLGVSYQLAPGQVIGLDGKGMRRWTGSLTDGQLAQIGGATPLLVRLRRDNQAQAQNRAFHAFYIWRLDTLGSSLSVDGDYYRQASSQQDGFGNTFLVRGAPDARFNAHQDQVRSSALYALKVDWTQKTKFATLESGFKASSVMNTSWINLDSLLGSNQHPLPGYTNAFTYREQIQAVYVSIHKPLKGLDLKTGLRYEHTVGFDPRRQVVNRQYGYLFPSASLTTQLGAHQLTFSYRKSLIRPVYTNLNPFTYYTDAYNAVAGNPALNPALAHIGELNYILKNTRLLTVNFIQMQDATLDVLTYDSLRQINQSRPQSIGLVQTWYIATGQALQLAKGWSVSTDLAALCNRIIVPTHQGQWSWTAQVSSDWQLDKGWSASLLAKYASPSLFELWQLYSVGTVEVGLKKMIAKGKGFIALDGNDLFYSDRYKASYQYGSVQQETLRKWQSRTLRITVNYTFGRSTVVLSNKRDIAPDEVDRLKQE